MNTSLSAFVGVCEYLVRVWVSASLSCPLTRAVYISIHLAASAVADIVTRCGGTGRIINYSRDQIICVLAGVGWRRGGAVYRQGIVFFANFATPLAKLHCSHRPLPALPLLRHCQRSELFAIVLHALSCPLSLSASPQLSRPLLSYHLPQLISRPRPRCQPPPTALCSLVLRNY